MTMVADPPAVGVDLPLEPEVGTEPVPEVCPPDYKALADLMREGARRRGQCTGSLFFEGRSCAWGAVWEALMGKEIGFGSTIQFGRIILERTGVDVHTRLRGPHNVTWPMTLQPGMDSLWGHVVNLNDRRGWTRQQIANWIESLGKGDAS